MQVLEGLYNLLLIVKDSHSSITEVVQSLATATLKLCKNMCLPLIELNAWMVWNLGYVSGLNCVTIHKTR